MVSVATMEKKSTPMSESKMERGSELYATSLKNVKTREDTKSGIVISYKKSDDKRGRDAKTINKMV